MITLLALSLFIVAAFKVDSLIQWKRVQKSTSK